MIYSVSLLLSVENSQVFNSRLTCVLGVCPTEYRDYKLAQFLNLSISFDYCILLMNCLFVDKRNEFYGDIGICVLG